MSVTQTKKAQAPKKICDNPQKELFFSCSLGQEKKLCIFMQHRKAVTISPAALSTIVRKCVRPLCRMRIDSLIHLNHVHIPSGPFLSFPPPFATYGLSACYCS